MKIIGVWEMRQLIEKLPDDYYLAIDRDYKVYILDEYGQPYSLKEENEDQDASND